MTEMTERQALDTLFEGVQMDLTADGYLDAMSALRKKRTRALANRVERALSSRLDELFPRRRIAWHEASVGTKYRVALLPDNPLFRDDVTVVRRALGIPEDVVGHAVVPDELTLLAAEGATAMARRNLAQEWIRRHERAHADLPADGLSGGLGAAALESAERAARLDLAAAEPDWLRPRPNIHSRCAAEETPYHRAVARLIERHRLPPHICGRVQIHVLTNESEDLRGLEPLSVSTIDGPGEVQVEQSTHTLAMTVAGIDEYTTKREWGDIWDKYIRPHQDERWYQRGQGPTGRLAPGLKRLSEGLPLYVEWLKGRTVEAALIPVQDEDKSFWGTNTQTANALINDLNDLLQPPP